MIVRRSACLLALSLLTWHAVAQPPVYRCGTDRARYQQAPCEDGAALHVDDATSESRRRAAHAVALSEARLAETLEKERQASEAQALARPAGGFRTTPPLGSKPGTGARRADSRKNTSKQRGESQRTKESKLAVQD